MGVYNAAGTRLTRAGLPITPFVDPDPQYVVTQNLTRKRPYYGDHGDDVGEGSEVQAIAYAGQIVRNSEISKWFTTAAVTGVSPSTAVPVAGGTTITLTGTGLDGVTAVQVGGTAGTAVTVVNASTVTFVAPAKTAGTYTITVTDDSGTITDTNAITFA